MTVSSCTAIGPAQGWPGRGLRYFISFSVRRACTQGESSAEFSPPMHARRAYGMRRSGSVTQAVGFTSSSRPAPLGLSDSSRRFHFVLAACAARAQ
ncbi:hypothetical protein OCU_45480 [Mycobacterium intracellulare ATCC 13950]|uniref:Uncharacterized protein n=1 Tax=Mycobacterium intracellulare (strain ATCC 13950 / DSM 43223 / JCM 6384 / NCTC 13025 / 3600) TaxID=487521 RepID=H8IUA4_MYCIA|nr:hypothetical protein OCU_45480 [Mycobacterium intracellulare ATCC 13950]ASQ88440.1 hypothetical protein CE197_24685 [Mycobacterium intracellulare subsp. chimaera]ETZ32174.1 hypothetical protein L843_4884 [Mycobacterium intracellulare MIN_061107_1834]